ncbi:hypothetical protein SAMN04515667_2566 [Formosa sp. Hel1_31_208]|uniref:hypothetical protein n=1 Tax=Formosa sp. Hel1_31_208 TaxID=1798225 RepID=UPI00087A94FE|nr:hypothetical protein [Formosa sp. Hel1_31_208]SDS61180.1 hypothetical protein SAMN04515667_2566 [Formosa sp. Hel1_31_208]
MKQIEFLVDNHIIIYRLNWLGIETIIMDGRIISKKLSLGKRVHTFNLTVDDIVHSFHIESKQSFSTSSVRIQLFQNGKLIDTDYVEFFENTKKETANFDNSSLMIGVLFIAMTLCFGWSKLFLFVGLGFLFDAMSKTHKVNEKAKTDKNQQTND